MTDMQKKAVMLMFSAVVDAVKAAEPHGAPGGVIYAAMSQFGLTLHQYEQLMSALVQAGNLRRSGELYFAT